MNNMNESKKYKLRTMLNGNNQIKLLLLKPSIQMLLTDILDKERNFILNELMSNKKKGKNGHHVQQQSLYDNKEQLSTISPLEYLLIMANSSEEQNFLRLLLELINQN